MAEKRGALNLEDRNTTYVMRLFVTGASPNSARAISNVKEICEVYL